MPGIRDRHGRGRRGPALAPDSPGARRRPSRRDRFDDLVLLVADVVEEPVRDRVSGRVEYAVEDAPVVPDNWAGESVPLSSLLSAHGEHPARIVFFRRPIEHRCRSRIELEAMLHDLLVEHLAEVLGVPPEDLDPDFGEA